MRKLFGYLLLAVGGKNCRFHVAGGRDAARNLLPVKEQLQSFFQKIAQLTILYPPKPLAKEGRINQSSPAGASGEGWPN
ncbi:hypothetical protein HC174_14990 [Salinimicrobium sp. CDJ15-81-2]|nr:hypothetical protein [Salinimicrobium nanhaiense]